MNVCVASLVHFVRGKVSAGQKRMERQKAEAERLADSWYQRAQLALQSGDENLAREALSRRQQQVNGCHERGWMVPEGQVSFVADVCVRWSSRTTVVVVIKGRRVE